VRLVGVSVSGLESAEDALPQLFPDERAERGLQIEDAAAKLRARFGERMLTRAALLDAPGSGPRKPR
jgi:hypothetical protein